MRPNMAVASIGNPAGSGITDGSPSSPLPPPGKLVRTRESEKNRDTSVSNVSAAVLEKSTIPAPAEICVRRVEVTEYSVPSVAKKVKPRIVSMEPVFAEFELFNTKASRAAVPRANDAWACQSGLPASRTKSQNPSTARFTVTSPAVSAVKNVVNADVVVEPALSVDLLEVSSSATWVRERRRPESMSTDPKPAAPLKLPSGRLHAQKH